MKISVYYHQDILLEAFVRWKANITHFPKRGNERSEVSEVVLLVKVVVSFSSYDNALIPVSLPRTKTDVNQYNCRVFYRYPQN